MTKCSLVKPLGYRSKPALGTILVLDNNINSLEKFTFADLPFQLPIYVYCVFLSFSHDCRMENRPRFQEKTHSMSAETHSSKCALANIVSRNKRGANVCEDRSHVLPGVPVTPLRILLSYCHAANEELVRRIYVDLNLGGHDD
jgi:hypothetical protein